MRVGNWSMLSGARIAKIYRVTGGVNTIDIQTGKIGFVQTGNGELKGVVEWQS